MGSLETRFFVSLDQKEIHVLDAFFRYVFCYVTGRGKVHPKIRAMWKVTGTGLQQLGGEIGTSQHSLSSTVYSRPI